MVAIRRRFGAVMLIPDAAGLNVRQRKGAADRQLRNDGAGAGVAKIKVTVADVTGDAVLHLTGVLIRIDHFDDTGAVRSIGGTEQGAGNLQRTTLRRRAGTGVDHHRRLVGRPQQHRNSGLVAVEIVRQRTGVVIVDLVLEAVCSDTPAETGIDLNAAGVHIAQIAAGQIGERKLAQRRMPGQIGCRNGGPYTANEFFDAPVRRQRSQRVGPAAVGGIRVADGNDGGIQHLDMIGLTGDAGRKLRHREVGVAGNRRIVDVGHRERHGAAGAAHLAALRQ